ncbi:MAG: hypothetical protein NTZ65_03430 [Candidatus Berkelbacteria bacterium]|nr:hypothetical protein [Candidatus Berkelbacteria bacterium]
MKFKVAFLGAGHFGYALAYRFARAEIETMIWGRSAMTFAYPMGANRDFPARPTPLCLRCMVGDFPDNLKEFGLIFVTTDSSGVEDVLDQVSKQEVTAPVLLVQKGLINGKSPVSLAQDRGLNAGSFTGAAFALDVFNGAEAMMIVASQSESVRETVMQTVRPLKFWTAPCDRPDAICAVNVARTIASVEMGMLLGYAKRVKEAEQVPAGDFSPTELAAAASSIEYECQVVACVLDKGCYDLFLSPREADSIPGRSRITRVLRADQLLCSGMIGESKSRNWRYGYAQGQRREPEICDGVVEGVGSIIDLAKRWKEEILPPFFASAARVIAGETTVHEEITVIRARRDAWYQQ